MLIGEYLAPKGAIDERREGNSGFGHILEALLEVLADKPHVLLEVRQVELLELLFGLVRSMVDIAGAGVGMLAEVVINVEIDHANARDEGVDFDEGLLGRLQHWLAL